MGEAASHAAWASLDKMCCGWRARTCLEVTFPLGMLWVGLENSLETRPKTTKSPEESLGNLDGVFPVLFAGRWWVSAFGAPSIREGEGIQRA